MQTLSYTAPNGLLLTKLQDELIAAIPALAPVNNRAVFALTGNEATGAVKLYVADAVDPAQVKAVVNAHTPAPLAAPADSTRPPALPQALRDKLRPGGGAFTAAEQMTYNRWVYLVLRWLARMLTGGAE